MHNIFLGLGTNLGDKKANIKKAITLLKKKLVVKSIAPIYESSPVGFINQDNFYNTVLEIKTNLSPNALLRLIKDIEIKMGRKKRFINGPREIDIDILLFDDLIIEKVDLTIPHPRMHERDFVLKPLSDIAPEANHPLLGKKIKQILEQLPKAKKALLSVVTD